MRLTAMISDEITWRCAQNNQQMSGAEIRIPGTSVRNLQSITWTPFPDRHASTRVHHRRWLDSHKTGYEVSTFPTIPTCPPMTDRPPLPKTLRRCRLTSSLNNPRNRTKAPVPPANFSRKYSAFMRDSWLFMPWLTPLLSRKESVTPGIRVDMHQRKQCKPDDMIRFLLALCCRDDSSTTAVSRDEVLDRRFEDCMREAIPIANSDELRRRLVS